MDPRRHDDVRGERRSIDHVELADGTLLVFDPQDTDAWIECRAPVSLAGVH
jgi:hypothetical protein